MGKACTATTTFPAPGEPTASLFQFLDLDVPEPDGSAGMFALKADATVGWQSGGKSDQLVSEDFVLRLDLDHHVFIAVRQEFVIPQH